MWNWQQPLELTALDSTTLKWKKEHKDAHGSGLTAPKRR
jgi:hypothetical protein